MQIHDDVHGNFIRMRNEIKFMFAEQLGAHDVNALASLCREMCLKNQPCYLSYWLVVTEPWVRSWREAGLVVRRGGGAFEWELANTCTQIPRRASPI